MGMQPFPFESLFEENELGRRLLFQSALPQNLSQQQQRQASNLFIPSFNQFLGVLGGDIRNNRTPTTFSSFVNDGFNLPQQLATLPDQSTPGLTSRNQFGF